MVRYSSCREFETRKTENPQNPDREVEIFALKPVEIRGPLSVVISSKDVLLSTPTCSAFQTFWPLVYTNVPNFICIYS